MYKHHVMLSFWNQDEIDKSSLLKLNAPVNIRYLECVIRGSRGIFVFIVFLAFITVINVYLREMGDAAEISHLYITDDVLCY